MPNMESIQFPSRFININEKKIHYLDEGKGNPMLFLHGMPTFSYLWRNIIPVLSPCARCIAPDLMGTGFSSKPNIQYSIFDHIEMIENFIEALGLSNITLVMHEWGSVIGLTIAEKHPEKIKAVVFYESYLRPITHTKMLSLPVQHIAVDLQDSNRAYQLIFDENYLIEKWLQASAICCLTKDLLDTYRQPFQTKASKQVLWQYIQELPLGIPINKASPVNQLIEKYSMWLQHTPIPKLLFYGIPGFITTIETVHWAKDHFSNLQLEVLEDVMHLAQESEPDLFSKKLLRWYQASL